MKKVFYTQIQISILKSIRNTNSFEKVFKILNTKLLLFQNLQRDLTFVFKIIFIMQIKSLQY